MTLHYESGSLTWGEFPLTKLTAEGTPLYIYHEETLRATAASFLAGIAALPGPAHLCYATKANGNPEIIKIFHGMGLGADVTSGGELYLAQAAGVAPADIIYSGVGKSAAEIRLALQSGIRALHVESAAEFEAIAAIAQREQIRARIGIRVNPNVTASTHPYISTGGKQHKFGVNSDMAAALLRRATENEWLEPAGLAIHIGSQIVDLEPFEEAVALLISLGQQLRSEGVPLDYLDVGGGLGIDYTEASPTPQEWVRRVATPVVEAGFAVALEPGRSLVGAAGLLLTRVEYLKQQEEKQFVIVDGGMNDLIRPTLYKAHHPILPVKEPAGPQRQIVDVVGPVCESGDYFA
ncbi:MAG: diaminopimelate decarboxylase, partial [Anaerolineales bacterium]|nr:diaminopimelate decarboxylase [Anaerolineales bacterium]